MPCHGMHLTHTAYVFSVITPAGKIKLISPWMMRNYLNTEPARNGRTIFYLL